METKAIDFILSFLSITLLVVAALLTVQLLTVPGRYHLVFDGLVFLMSYGVYSALLLKTLRKIKPYPQGRFKMSSPVFGYWKLCAVIVDLASKAFNIYNTVFTQPLIYAVFGARIGRNTAIAGVMRDHPLITVQDFATIGQNSVVTAHVIVHDEIILKPITVGRNAVVGINCVIMPGVTIEEGAVVAPGSVVKMDTCIPRYEFWGGIPARKIKDLTSSD